MSKKPKISPEDVALFQKAVAGAKPLTRGKLRIRRPSRTKVITRGRVDPDPLPFNISIDLDPVQSEEFISYHHPSISNKTLRKLRKGQYNVEASLDLHGMIVDEAISAVDRFLQECLQAGMRVVLIIHGKGHHSQTPVLKNKLNQWLRELDVVLAFCSAAPTHGSRGAIYIMLRKQDLKE